MDVPSQCPVCGAYSLSHDEEASRLLAVCDILVIRALQDMGKWLLRVSRLRHTEWGDRALHEVHTRWQATDEVVDKALKNAWDVVPAVLGTYGCHDVTTEAVTCMLDEYVHDLAITGYPHTIEELQYRFIDRLGLPVYLKKREPADALV